MVQLAEVILHFLDISTDFMSNLMIAAVSWWRNASTVANGDLSFCRPAAHSRVNASVSVPVQSYRSEGSQALCLVNPWERPHSVLLSENRNTDSIGKTARAGGGKKRAWIPHIRKIHGRNTVMRNPRKKRAKEYGENEVQRQMKLDEMKVIRMEWNERNS